jgi:hypothetical protein
MTSAFQDSFRGFGLPMTAAELKIANEKRAGLGRSALEQSPGLLFFRYGKNRDNYWDFEHFKAQSIDYMDCVEVLYKHYQMVIEVDHSSGHCKYADDALVTTSKVNKSWGGVQRKMKCTSNVTAEMLGPPAKRQEIDKGQLQVGDTAHHVFTDPTKGPYYAPEVEALDRPWSLAFAFHIAFGLLGCTNFLSITHRRLFEVRI